MVSYFQQDTAVSRRILVISTLDLWSMGDGKGKGATVKGRTVFVYFI